MLSPKAQEKLNELRARGMSETFIAESLMNQVFSLNAKLLSTQHSIQIKDSILRYLLEQYKNIDNKDREAAQEALSLTDNAAMKNFIAMAMATEVLKGDSGGGHFWCNENNSRILKCPLCNVFIPDARCYEGEFPKSSEFTRNHRDECKVAKALFDICFKKLKF